MKYRMIAENIGKCAVLFILPALASATVPAAKAKQPTAKAAATDENRVLWPGPLKPVENTEKYESLALFQKVLFFVEQNYVEEVKSKDLIYGAIKGMLETLDPHSSFLPPEIFKDMKADTSGRFGGVGIEIGMKNDALTVVSPIEDTPAFKAGIKPGDKIIKVEGESAKGLSMAEAVAKMRGKKGTELRLTIWREGLEKPVEYKLMREEIKIKTVKHEELEPSYLYARLTNFNENSAHELLKAMEKQEDSKGGLHGMVLDLRNNPGGLLDQAIDVTSLFIDDGVVVSTMGRSAESKEIRYAKKGLARKDLILAVLVNGSSASASEIVAGALQDHKRAVVMGQPTFGKGSVQTVVELKADVGLKLTIARYYTPKGRSIQLKGITPDVLLEDLDSSVLNAAKKKGSSLREKDLSKRINNDQDRNALTSDDMENITPELAKKEDVKTDGKIIAPKDDYMVREALNYIKSYQIFRTAEKERGVKEVVKEASSSTAAVKAN